MQAQLKQAQLKQAQVVLSALLCYIFGMRKIKILTVALIVFSALVALCSCATKVDLNMLVPAETNLGGKTVIAVSSTTVDSFSFLNSNAAKYASKMIQTALSQGVYSVIGCEETDSIVNSAKYLGIDPTVELLKRGVSVLIQTSLIDIGYHDEFHEHFFKDNKGVLRVNVTVQRVAELSLSCTVWDLKTKTIIDSFVLTDTKTSDEKDFHLGPGHHDSNDIRIDTGSLYQSILHNFKNKIRDRLVPHFDTFKVKLLKDETKSSELKNAYAYVKDGHYESALAIFRNNWDRTLNPAAGYNAAVLYYAIEEYDKAVEFAENVFDITGNAEIAGLIEYFRSLTKMQESAIAQVDGSAPQTIRKQDIRY